MDAKSVLAAAAFNQGRLKQIVAEIPDDKMLHRPTPESNPALWVIGHMAVLADVAASLLGAGREIPAEWRKAFGQGSDPGALEGMVDRPTRATVAGALTSATERLMDAASKAGDEAWNRPHGLPQLAGTSLKTAGDFAVHVLTTHAGFHLGQLALVRRSLGKGPLL